MRNIRLLRLAFVVVIPAIVFRVAIAGDASSASSILARAGYTEEQCSRVLAGKFVSGDIPESAQREIGLSLAFLIRAPEERLVRDFLADRMEHLDPSVVASGEIHGMGSLKEFDGLVLAEDSESTFLLEAEPGEDANFSTEEFAQFEKIRLNDPGNAREAAQQALRRMMLSRHRAYRTGGLESIAPYDRGDGKFEHPGHELARATRAHGPLDAYGDALFATLLDYPKAQHEDLEDRFYWSRYELDEFDSRPTFVLTHLMDFRNSNERALVERQYYVSQGYNTEQGVLTFWPVKEGTLVLYVNRTSTDRVAGFGSGFRHNLGRKLMRKKLESLYKKLGSQEG